jgi:hypothetical protein
MTIKQETKFKTTDGREFVNEKEAKKHDELIVAREQYETALRKMNRLIAETTRTADGHLFELGLWASYYYVTPGFFSMPQLAEVSYLGWNWDLNEHNDSVEIITREGNDNRQREYKIKDLYREKSKALTALVEAQKAWLAERQSQIDETAAKVAQGIDPTR